MCKLKEKPEKPADPSLTVAKWLVPTELGPGEGCLQCIFRCRLRKRPLMADSGNSKLRQEADLDWKLSTCRVAALWPAYKLADNTNQGEITASGRHSPVCAVRKTTDA